MWSQQNCIPEMKGDGHADRCSKVTKNVVNV